jgi:hypothetical protein
MMLAGPLVLMLLAGHPIRIDRGAGAAGALFDVPVRILFRRLGLFACSQRVARGSSKSRECDRSDEKTDLPDHDVFSPTLAAPPSAKQSSLSGVNVFEKGIGTKAVFGADLTDIHVNEFAFMKIVAVSLFAALARALSQDPRAR